MLGRVEHLALHKRLHMSTALAAYIAENPGLGINQTLEQREWLALAGFITQLERHTPFYFADLVHIARRSYGWDYEVIRDHFATAGRDFEFQTLRNYAYVASRFPIAQRCYGPHVRFGHYEAIAPLVPEVSDIHRPLPTVAHELLLATATDQLTVAEVRRRVSLLTQLPAPSKEPIYWTIKPHRVREFLVPAVDFSDPRWEVLHTFLADDEWTLLQQGTIQFSIKVFEVQPLEEEHPSDQ